jgi:phage tail sheath gpL-like
MSGHPLTGVDPNDPIPGQKIEIRFEQGKGSGASQQRKVVFLGQKTSDGSEDENTLGVFVADYADAIERFGVKSELVSQMYAKYIEIDPDAEIYMIAIPAGGGATASEVDFTIATNASASTTLVVEWAGDEVEVSIASGDTPTTQAANVAAAINDKAEWPWSAAAALGVVTATVESPIGPRGDFVLNGLRMYYRKNVSSTVTKGSITSGTTDDDQTTALGILATRDLYYQVSSKSPTTTATSTDNGVGEHAAQITALALPARGIRQQMFWGFVGQSSSVATIATSINNVRAEMAWAQGTSWTPAMLAAHFAAVVRSQQVAHPGARLTGYGKGTGDIFRVPKPWLSADLPLENEIRSALNNGATPIDWTPTGQGFIVRQITSRSLNGTVNDYRARSGHIPSALDYSAAFIADNIATTAQDFVADDPPEGTLPLENTTYPNQVAGEARSSIDQLVQFAGGPVLDPTVLDQMKASVEARFITNGVSLKMSLEAVKHNDKTNLLILETSTGV